MHLCCGTISIRNDVLESVEAAHITYCLASKHEIGKEQGLTIVCKYHSTHVSLRDVVSLPLPFQGCMPIRTMKDRLVRTCNC